MVSAALDSEEEINTPKKCAKESIQTQRAREKLKKQLQDVEKKITSEALHEKSQEIHQWIARHAHVRVTLKDKNISLFDENQNAARLSGKISALAQRLKETGIAPTENIPE